jgi:hypothetical protein
MERRKVLFTDGMSDDFLLIITDAPKAVIEEYCRWHVCQVENGWKDCETFQPLKVRYYIKELLDSEVDNREDLELIGYDECYDFSTYHN